MSPTTRPYHHGNLRRALIDEALAVIEERGPLGLSMRELARRLGVSHAAPDHHFEDKTALLTVIATEGYEQLVDVLTEAAAGGLLEVGLAYVRFSLDHPAHVQVMYQPSLYRADDPAIVKAKQRCGNVLYGAASRVPSDASLEAVGVAGWSLMHGFVGLWMAGNIRNLGDDPMEAARAIAAAAFGGHASTPPRSQVPAPRRAPRGHPRPGWPSAISPVTGRRFHVRGGATRSVRGR